MKNIILTILFTLASAQFVFCYAEVFEVSATIPLIPGVNYFPEAADIAPAAKKGQISKDTVQQLVLRDGRQIILSTSTTK